MSAKYIAPLLTSAIDAGEFEVLVNELTDLLWNTATDWPTRGGLPTLEEVTIDGDAPSGVFVVEARWALEEVVRAALDGAV